MTDEAPKFAPCRACGQYSHSIGADALTEAYNHFQAMVYGHPLKDYPTDYAFSDETRDAAQVLMAAAKGERDRIVAWMREQEDTWMRLAEKSAARGLEYADVHRSQVLIAASYNDHARAIEEGMHLISRCPTTPDRA